MAAVALHHEQPLAAVHADVEPEREPESGSSDLLDMVDELLALAGGAGFFFVAFLAAIPGLVPAVLLVVAFAAVLALPVIALGLVADVVAAVVWVLTRLFRLVTGRAG